MSRTAQTPATKTTSASHRLVAAAAAASLVLVSVAACATTSEEELQAPATDVAEDASAETPIEDTQVNASSQSATIPKVWSTDHEKFDAPSKSEIEEIDELFSAAVEDSAANGVTLTWCLQSLDTKEPVSECVGDDETTFAASIPKLAVTVAAIEAYEGELDTEIIDYYTPWSAGNAGLRAQYDEAMGREADEDVSEAADEAQANDTPTTLGDLVAASISYSDNDAVNELIDAMADGPAFGKTDANADADATNGKGASEDEDEDPGMGEDAGDDASTMTSFEYIDALTDRIGIAEEFHVGAYFNQLESGDWNHITASTAAEYLHALVTAADSEATGETLNEVAPDALTSPKVARTVLSAMAQQFRSTKIPGDLPTGTYANKTGETDTESHDLAVVGTKNGRYVLSAVSNFPEGTTAPDEQLAETAKDVVGVLGGSERL